uniref:Uncharacterized protein n=1 Tax=Labrus bergylta TaxID=56723 RepID=A0A3Q3G1L7_9LABR
MIFRFLFNLINNPQVIEKLAESRPIRRAAQITAYAITKAQIAGRDASQRALRSRTLQQPLLKQVFQLTKKWCGEPARALPGGPACHS